MKPPDRIVIDGRPYSWKTILDLRRAQIEKWKTSRSQQPALFDLVEDCRPKAERTAAGRYAEPTLLTLLRER